MCAPTGLITSADIPVDDGSSSGERPEFSYAEQFHGFDIEQDLFRFLRGNLPRERSDGKQLHGVAVTIWRPNETDSNNPWMSFAFDANFDFVEPRVFTGSNAEQIIYGHNARRKMRFTMRTGLPSSAAVTTHRHLRAVGDFCFDGAVIHRGIPVAISGYTQEMGADESVKVADHVADLMLQVVDTIDATRLASDGNQPHYWGESWSKAQLIRVVEAGLPISEIGTFMSALDGSDGITSDDIKAFEI